ncbi:pyridoxal-dependent decarboxylase [Arachidicoccus ginsenosidivorans]|uniref:Aspartate aminotransferase family protein n=1 Tax=Arachidicoccus ginsenosidivorans TaxID=496057 RepID=A0A5B8VM47_9BACT|nr:pyridoxal-dependent decarboxylase [Arachidicoccus ginsenosidivorans]QEC71666.1 aspartate aminotransferase family protein [Arachidicoccus ginsenosidivorans]
MKYWKKLSAATQDSIISQALKQNVNYWEGGSLGVPASTLDDKVFYGQASFLKDSPWLRLYVHNPNHIGCHTLGESEPFFKGTQQLEKEVISLLSEDLLGAAEKSTDGYIASGGTEANLQAIWIYRNYFQKEYLAQPRQIALIASEDTHYSIAKGAGIFGLHHITVPVEHTTRLIEKAAVEAKVRVAMQQGVRYFIVVANMATTMFGSVDDPDIYTSVLKAAGLPFKLHVDGAFGGFIYPVATSEIKLDFKNPDISSITLDAHKMLQAPYGTGIFLARKNLMQYVYTEQAAYVNGMDITLSGSRSGANAVAVWMILMTYGYYGWQEKIQVLLNRTSWFCKELEKRGIRYYRHKYMNIVTIYSEDLQTAIAEKYYLVPDKHTGPASWYKIVVMEHVDQTKLLDFLSDLDKGNG